MLGLVACADDAPATVRVATPVQHELVEESLPPITDAAPTLRARPELKALAGLGGLIVQARGGDGAEFVVELWQDGAWVELTHMGAERMTWVGPPVSAPVSLRARSVAWQGEVEFDASAPSLTWLEDVEPGAMLEGDHLARSLGWSVLPLDIGPVSSQISLTARDEIRYLPGGCEAVSCWQDTIVPFATATDLASAPETLTMAFRAPALGPAVGELMVQIAARVDDEPVVLARAAMELRLLGGRWRWGDLHAHSRWSNDGCEDELEYCAPRGDLPAEDFFANAADASLDFAAITDHAEYDYYWPQGDSGEALEVWDGQAGAVVAALSGLSLPILGYEWTASSNEMDGGHERGSHRTVLLGDPSACRAYRIAGAAGPTRWSPELGDWAFTDSEGTIETTVGALWPALDEAGDECGSPVRWLTFAHHPAYSIPQSTDWYLEENRPDREDLVEIYSEHGSSECEDPDADGCEFGMNASQRYYASGAVQTALDQGFQLGFLAGTDSHDSRPGSLDDGPSAVAWWRDSDGDGVDETAAVQFGPGGISGVLVGGTLDTGALFDALEERRTVATSGPRPDLHAYALDASGRLYAVGAVLQASEGPFTLIVDELPPRDSASDATLVRIERLGPGGVVEDGTDELRYEGTWAPTPGDYTYLRLRYMNVDDDAERVWISPWFVQ